MHRHMLALALCGFVLGACATQPVSPPLSTGDLVPAGQTDVFRGDTYDDRGTTASSVDSFRPADDDPAGGRPRR